MLFTVMIATLAIAFLVCYKYLLKNRGKIEHLGISVIKPGWLFGSLPYSVHKVHFHQEYQKNFEHFGKTFGYYEGVTPIVATTDLDIIKAVLVKNFESFSDVVDFHVDDKYTSLDISGGEKWKDLRKNLSPTFTSGKLKGMLEPMNKVTDAMVNHIDKLVKKDPKVDAKKVFTSLALDTISKCAFSIDTDVYNNPEHDLLKYGSEFFSSFRLDNWVMSMIFHLTTHFPVLMNFISIFPKSIDKVTDVTKDIMANRGEQDNIGTDFISRLMEMKRKKAQNPNAEYFKALNDEIIQVQGTIFFLAGYETTANTLCTLSYNLARLSEIQESVYQEIKDVTDAHEGIIDHETIGEMNYLEAAINENLRLNGPVNLHFRMCKKDCEVAPGFVIKEGTRVDMPLWACHHNKEYFSEPDKFIPERFLTKNKDDIKPYSFRPFGGGPRFCIGQRFAMIEMKLAMAKLLLKYKIVNTPETKLDTFPGDQFLLSFPNMIIKLEQRN